MQIIKKISLSKRKLYILIATVALIFSIISFIFFIKWDRTIEDQTNYNGDADGTSWEGYQSGSLNIRFNEHEPDDDSRLTCVVISNNNYAATNLVFPTLIENPVDNLLYELVEIAENAFADNLTITGSITLPTSLEIIGGQAFANCKSLRGNLIIPNNVTTIGWSAFRAIGLNGTLQLGNHVETIRYSAFEQNNFTGNLIIPNSVTEINYSAFANAGFTGQLQLSNNLEIIPESGFVNCGFTGSLNIPNCVKEIKGFAFEGCAGFTGDLVIPNSVTNIDWDIVRDCTALTGKLILPDTVTSINASFSHSYLSTVVFSGPNSPATLFHGTQNFSTTFQTIVFDGWNSVPAWANNDVFQTMAPTGVVETTHGQLLPSDALIALWEKGLPIGWLDPTNVDPTAYAGNSTGTNWKNYQSGSLNVEFIEPTSNDTRRTCRITNNNSYAATNLIFPSLIQNPANNRLYTLVEIGTNAFSNDDLFTGQITFPTPLEKIGNYSFYNCLGLRGNLTIPRRVTTIGEYAFSNILFDGNLTLSNHLTTIGASAFDGNNFSGSLIIPDSVTSIGSNTFANAGFTGQLQLSNNLTIIPAQSFYNCTFSGSLVIPEGVEQIQAQAFEACTGFAGDLILPDSLRIIGDSIVKNCTGLTGKLVIKNAVETINQSFRYSYFAALAFMGENTHSNLFTGATNFSPSYFQEIIFDGWNSEPKWALASIFANMQATGIVRSINGALTATEALFYLWDQSLPITWLDPSNLDPTNYIANENGTNWKGYQSGSLTVQFTEPTGGAIRGTCRISSQNKYGAKDLIFPSLIRNPANDRLYALTTIGATTFMNNLTIIGSLTLPTSLIIIENQAFAACSSLSGDLIIPNNVTKIDPSSFRTINFGGNLQIGSSVQTIGYSAFDASGFIGDLYLPDSITSVEAGAFVNAGFTGNLRLSNNMQEIADSAFKNCAFTGNLFIPNNIKLIRQYAFAGCQNLTGDLTLPQGVTTIQIGIVQNCANLTGKLSIPSTVTSINQSFIDSSLTSVVFYGPNASTSLFAAGSAFAASFQEIIFDGWNALPNWTSATNPFSAMAANGTVRAINGNLLATNLLTYLEGKGLPTGWSVA
ncbi:MAG: leucine-rich repeat domain-containing protein [Mycoplasmataceae bacterium]|nr:leucine-rich repeat domain-containing protein [Mycoplasmataceae bacterium]